VNNSDKDIQNLFQSKLGEFESNVPDNLWSEIAQQLPSVSGSSAGAASSTSKPLISTVAKWVIGAAAVTSAVIGIVLFAPNNTEVTPASPLVSDNSEAISAPIDTLRSTATEEKNNTRGEAPLEKATLFYADDVPSKENTSIVQNDVPGEKTNPTVEPLDEQKEVATAQKPETAPSSQNRIDTQAREPKESLSAAFTYQRVGDSGLSFFFIPKEDPSNTFSWDFGNGKTSNALSPNHLFEIEGEYTVRLTVTSADGTHKETEQTLCAYRPGKIKAPNAFSPGNDASNEYFDLRSWSSNIAEYKEFNILDSNGKVVFSSQQEPLWNGADMAGNLCSAGDYSFTVVCFDMCQNRIVKAGPIRLFRP
jgi:PKD repeat protein